MKVLLGVSGAMPAMNFQVLGKALLEAGHELQVVMTDDAYQYVNPHSTHDCFIIHFADRMAALNATPPIPVVDYNAWKQVKVWRDTDDSFKKGEQRKYLQLRDWADVLLVAPCSANVLAKFALGLSDDLLTRIFRSWIFDQMNPVVIAPAMDQFAWANPWTKLHFEALRQSPSFKVTEKSLSYPYKDAKVFVLDPKLSADADNDSEMTSNSQLVGLIRTFERRK